MKDILIFICITKFFNLIIFIIIDKNTEKKYIHDMFCTFNKILNVNVKKL